MPTAKPPSSSPESRTRAARTTRKSSYHREDLRGELLAAAHAHIRQYGHADLSIRVLAQRCGVSTAAPYHHFADRRALLREVAVLGFAEMLQSAETIAISAIASQEKLRQSGLLFLQFAESNPHLVDLMYESELTVPVLEPELLHYQRRGHQFLKGILADLAPALDDEEADLRILSFWATIYGFASMRRKGVLHTNESGPVPTLDIGRRVVDRAVLAATA